MYGPSPLRKGAAESHDAGSSHMFGLFGQKAYGRRLSAESSKWTSEGSLESVVRERNLGCAFARRELAQ